MPIFEIEVAGKVYEIDAPDVNAAARAGKAMQDDRPGMASGIARAAAQGATFGFGDEIEAALRTLGGFNGDYTKTRDEIRTKVDQFKQDHPVIAHGTEIAAGVALPGGMASQAVKHGVGLGRAVAGTSALSGALYGAGNAEEMKDVPIEALKGGGTGLATGAVVSKALPAARAINRVLPDSTSTMGGVGYSLVTGDLTGLLAGPVIHVARKMIGKEAAPAGDRIAEALRKGMTSATATNAATDLMTTDDNAAKRRARERLAQVLAEAQQQQQETTPQVDPRLLQSLMMGAP